MSAAAIGRPAPKNTLFGRYLRDHYFRPPSQNFTPNNLLTSTQGALNDADQGWAFGDTYLFSATLVNQFRASVDRIGIHRYDDNYVSACDLGVVGVYCGYVPHQSGFAVTGAFALGPGTGGQAVAHTTPLQLNDDISWVKGNHQINFGGGAIVSKMLFDGNVYSQTNWTFPNMGAFFAGYFSSNSLSLPNNLNLKKWNPESVYPGHLEGDSQVHRERGPALGTVHPSREYHGLDLQLQPGESGGGC